MQGDYPHRQRRGGVESGLGRIYADKTEKKLKNKIIEYEIFKIYSIDPDDVSCVESVESGTREITLITCTNGHKNRLVTKARQIL